MALEKNHYRHNSKANRIEFFSYPEVAFEKNHYRYGAILVSISLPVD